MKKHSKFIVLFAIIAVTLSLFYIRVETLTKSYAQFEIKTIEGDESAIDSLVIKGDMYSSYLQYEPFKLTKDGVTYLRDESFFERIDYYEPEYTKKVKKETRKFLRGKSVELSNFAERENMIYHVEIPFTRWGLLENVIKVQSYDRETKKITKHQFDAPDLLEYAYVETIIPHDNQLYIAVLTTEYMPQNDKEIMELQIYNYDLVNEQVDEPIKIEMAEDSGYSEFITVFPDDEKNPQELIVGDALLDYIEIEAETNASSFEDEDDIDYLEFISLGVIKKVNLKTKEVSTIEFTKDKSESIGIPVGFNGQKIVFANSEGNQLIYSVYVLESQKISQPITIDLDMPYISLWEFANNIVKGDKAYTIINDESNLSAYLLVVDTEKVELAYQGKVEMTEQEQFGKSDIEAYFHTMEIVE